MLTKVWTTLMEWQESIASLAHEDEEPFSLEEPRPPSEHFFAQARRSTRTMATAASSNTVAIYSSAQLIPPILSLIDLTLELPVLREAIDEGAKEAREVLRKSREAVKLENERWDGVKKSLERSKDKAAVRSHLTPSIPSRLKPLFSHRPPNGYTRISSTLWAALLKLPSARA